VKDKDIDDILKRAAEARDVDRELLERVARNLGSNLQPVRPLPALWILASGLILICVAVALAGAMYLGPFGIRKMSALEIGLIFCVLGILVWIAAASSVAEMIPGSGRPAAPWIVSVSGCAALAAVFGLLFQDYGVVRFVPRGVACLTAGVAFALPASLATWWLLRRGFAVDSVAAGLAKGTLAGLAGVTMLELHCPIFEAPHVLVWHIAVLPVCGAAGMLAARAFRGNSGRQS
jgi:hypothetical protein